MVTSYIKSIALNPKLSHMVTLPSGTPWIWLWWTSNSSSATRSGHVWLYGHLEVEGIHEEHEEEWRPCQRRAKGAVEAAYAQPVLE